MASSSNSVNFRQLANDFLRRMSAVTWQKEQLFVEHQTAEILAYSSIILQNVLSIRQRIEFALA